MRKVFAQHKFLLLLIFLSFFLLTKFTIDPDFGWHLRLGSHFLETREIIYRDQFSWTMAGYAWGNHYFLYQIFTALIFEKFGYLFVAFIFGSLASFSVLILIWGQRVNFWKFLALSLAVGFASTNLSVRPHTISFLMFSILLILLEKRFFQKIWHTFFWFLFFAIWANFHQGYLVGLMILAIFFFFELIIEKFDKKKLIIFASIFVVSTLATLITPFGLSLWKTALFDLTGDKTWRVIAEWLPIAVYFPVNLLFALSGLIFVYIVRKNFKTIHPPFLFIVSFLFTLGFLVTNFVLFWIAAFIFIASRFLDFEINFKSEMLTKIPLFISTVAFVLAVILSFIVNLLESFDFEGRLVQDRYPAGAVSFLKKNNFKLNRGLFNDYGWGGFLIWQYPDGRVFIDGRMTGWRSNERYILDDYLKIKAGDCDILKKYRIEVVLVRSESHWQCFSSWNEVYKDSIAKVVVP